MVEHLDPQQIMRVTAEKGEQMGNEMIENNGRTLVEREKK